ncbi:blue copper protein 1b [Rhodamnia argentea]|uniref:Blue copper protein 1b n=1 Tax=Rhodamnia argentea TaxID=178133 RepID=A0A8B8NGC6_9MYRT|nr:blue copper protein 1b [Rhodamnia argentea]
MFHRSQETMAQGRYGFGLVTFYFCISCIALVSLSGRVEAYQNYTVGGSLGWYDNQEKPEIDYKKWASGKNFSLGDFLIFNTDTNHSVVQTYNSTTYKLCDFEDALEKDTIQWSSSDPSNTATHPVTVAVPLVKEGANYFFSSDYDGEQCQNGQLFMINVTHGQGLPESLKNPSDQSPGPASPDSGDDGSAPDTVVPSNFNNPQEQSTDDNESSGSVALTACGDKFLNGALLMFLGTALQTLMI